MSSDRFIPDTEIVWESKGEIWLNGRLNEQQERLERLELQVMPSNPLAGFEESGEVPRLEALVVSLQREERGLSERNKYLESRVQFLENHIRQVNRITARITGSEQAMEDNTLAAVEESRGFAQRAAP